MFFVLQRSGTECVDFAGGEFAGGVWAESRSTPGPCFEETSAIAHRAMFGQAGLGRAQQARVS